MSDIRDLPILSSVRLNKFSLYQQHRNLAIPVKPGVFCLAGANGMGKSTFLAAVNYGLTGVVPRPERRFNGVKRFYDDGLGFAHEYFDGRIQEEDRADASIELSFRIGSHEYTVTRRFFGRDAIKRLTVTDLSGYVILETADWDERSRDAAYQARICEDCRLPGFEYFVFMQHFMMTFDERRHLLFWDARAANMALHIAFGVAPDDIERSEELRLGIDGMESNARNAQWQATIARNSLAKLGGQDTASLRQLRVSHDKLVEQLTDAREDASQAERAANDAALAAAGAGAQQQTLRQEYDRVFSRKIAGQRDPARHPVIVQSLMDHICDICGSADDEAIATIRDALASHRCPLCNTAIQLSEDPNFEELQNLDDELAAAKTRVDTAQAKADRLRAEAAQRAAYAATVAEELDRFESANSDYMTAIMSPSGELEQQRRSLEGEFENAVARRDEYRLQRDEMRKQLEPLQVKLTAAYQEGELEFVPIFRKLAKSFIGIDLDISLYRSQNTFGLSLEMQGARRQSMTELSESQRFFIEIALKMSLTQFMRRQGSEACLLIDTPEGSLDIAYEARAGDMFADYVMAGFNLIMTANINSSQLLLRLAERCGSQHMDLVRMTEWTSLTEVQAAEEHLFTLAYNNIEEKLQGAGSIGGAEGP